MFTRHAAEPEQMSYGPDVHQVADVYRGSADLPLVLLVHGGYWRPEYDRVHLRPLAQAIADTGASVCSIEYRRQPGNPEVSVADVDLALGYPWSDLPHSGRIGVGHSAGGHLLLVALAHGVPLDSAIALAPVADLGLAADLHLDDGAVQDFCGQSLEFDPMHLPLPTAPLTILHGDADELVPLELSRNYAKRYGTLQITPSAGHFQLIDPMHDAGANVIALVRRHFG